MLILRLKQAESAVADGRLDEAFEIVRSEQVREHSRGQKLIGKLARAFAKRGFENLNAERIQLALADCNKAEKLAGNIEDVAKLRSQICSEMEQKRLRDKQRSLNIANAQEQIHNGWLSAGQKILDEDMKEDGQADMLMQQAAAVRIQMNEALAKAEQAMKRNDLEAAVEIIRDARLWDNKNEQVFELISKLKSLLARRIKDNFEKGRIDIAQNLWQKISPMVDYSSDISELGTMLSKTRRAAEYIADGRLREAIVLLKQVYKIYPAADWLESLTGKAVEAADLLDELASSPLGLNISRTKATKHDSAEPPHRKTFIPASQKPTLPGTPNIYKQKPPVQSLKSSQFVLQIDGVGSFLILREGRISIGPVSSSARPTIGLMADPNLPVATIERVDDDYFIRSSSAIGVNDLSTTEKLLVDGDRIAFSSRCMMRFNVPNPASTTATIQLSSARLSRGDIRRIILMDRDILIGPGEGNHIRTESSDDTIVLYFHNGRLHCKTDGKITVDDEPADLRNGLAINKQIRIGDISFVITETQ